MELDEYQVAAAAFKDGDDGVRWTLKLCAEAGEVAQLVERDVFGRDRHGPQDPEHLKLELGDVLWYLAAIAGSVGMSLQEVAEANIAKLQRRYPEKVAEMAKENQRLREEAYSAWAGEVF